MWVRNMVQGKDEKSIDEVVNLHQLRQSGHVLRMPNHRLPQRLLSGVEGSQGRPNQNMGSVQEVTDNWMLLSIDHLAGVHEIIMSNVQRLKIICSDASASTFCLPPNSKILNSSRVFVSILLIYIFLDYLRCLIFTITTFMILGFTLTILFLCVNGA